MLEGLPTQERVNGKRSIAGAVRYDWIPRADVHETADAFLINLDLPGVDDADIDMTVDNGVLKIAGHRRIADDSAGTTRWRMLRECPQGSFRRDFTLPKSADARAIDARLCNGVLAVRIAKRAQDRRRRIQIGH